MDEKIEQTTEIREIDEQQTKEFEKKVDMLALTLSLKENDDFFEAGEGYPLLFSTYIEMIKNDSDDFFIKKEQKGKIIESLERTRAFYDFEHKEQLQSIFEKITNNDPTDFMIFPSEVFLKGDEGTYSQFCGLTVYRKNEDFLVMRVDKAKCFDKNTVSYFKIPSVNVAELSQLFFSQRDFKEREPNFIFKQFKDLSGEMKVIPTISMKEQRIINGVVSEIEASLKMILFHCHTDIFRLGPGKNITPKWNLKHLEPTLEMRKRFLLALKGDNDEWNQHFDYIFDYYLYRKGKLVELPFSDIDIKSERWHQQIHSIFSMDQYIPEMIDSGGKVPTTKKTELKESVILSIEPTGRLYNEDIKMIGFSKLWQAKNQNEEEIKILNARFPSIKIELAQEMAATLISCLKNKNQEIGAEIKRREEIEKENYGKKYSHQTLKHSLSNTVFGKTNHFRKIPVNSNAEGLIEKAVFTEVMEKAKKSQQSHRNTKQQDARDKDKQSLQYEK
ncbi:hypothetical protein E1H99_00360 [Enterococcus hirae]|nr:hypothetical protein E1H99_00360 [Enterococcus hirae]